LNSSGRGETRVGDESSGLENRNFITHFLFFS
jgi:hypothetical protein